MGPHIVVGPLVKVPVTVNDDGEDGDDGDGESCAECETMRVSDCDVRIGLFQSRIESNRN